MIYNYKEREYKVMNQMGDSVQVTKAYRITSHNFIEVITVLDFKAIGETEVREATIYIQDLLDLAAVVEQERMEMA